MRAIIALVGIALFALIAVMGMNGALADNASLTTVENETWTPDAGNVTELNNSNLEAADYNETVTVRDSTGTVMSNQTDYTWFDGNGTVKATVGGGLDGESEATISYGYERAPDDQVELAVTLSQLPASAGAILPFGVILIFLLLIKG
jgi:hypothetical protein